MWWRVDCSFAQPYIVLSSRTIVEAGGVRGTGSLCYLLLSKRWVLNQKTSIKRHIIKPDKTPK